jgi:hypothetical protein
MHKKVSAEQFILEGDRLTHIPRGAEFWLAERDVVLCDEGAAGKPVFSGNDYNSEELKSVAWEIFQLQKG